MEYGEAIKNYFYVLLHSFACLICSQNRVSHTVSFKRLGDKTLLQYAFHSYLALPSGQHRAPSQSPRPNTAAPAAFVFISCDQSSLTTCHRHAMAVTKSGHLSHSVYAEKLVKIVGKLSKRDKGCRSMRNLAHPGQLARPRTRVALLQ